VQHLDFFTVFFCGKVSFCEVLLQQAPSLLCKDVCFPLTVQECSTKPKPVLLSSTTTAINTLNMRNRAFFIDLIEIYTNV
jgi:hypothetical protein